MSNNRETLTLTRTDSPPPGRNEGAELAADFFGPNGLGAEFFGSAHSALIGTELTELTLEPLPTPEQPQPYRDLAKVVLAALNDPDSNRGMYLMSAYVEATRGSSEDMDISECFDAFLDELSARLEKYQITDYKNAVRQVIVLFRQFIPEIRENKAERLAIKQELHAGINAFLAKQHEMEELASLRANPEINAQLRTRYTTLIKKHLSENGTQALFIQFIDNPEAQDLVQDFIDMGIPVADAAEMLLDTANYSELVANELQIAHSAQLDAIAVQEQFAKLMQARAEALAAAQPEQETTTATADSIDGPNYRLPRKTLLKLLTLGFGVAIVLAACSGQEVEPVSDTTDADNNAAEVAPTEESSAAETTIQLTRVAGSEHAVTTTENDGSQFNLSFNLDTNQIEFEQNGTVFELTIVEAEGSLGEQITLFNTTQGETIFSITWHAGAAPELTVIATGQKVALEDANVLESFQNIIDAGKGEVTETATPEATATHVVPTEQPTATATAESTATAVPTEMPAETEIESALAGKELWDYTAIVFPQAYTDSSGAIHIEKVRYAHPGEFNLLSPTQLLELANNNNVNAEYCSFYITGTNPSYPRFNNFGAVIDTVSIHLDTTEWGGGEVDWDLVVYQTCGTDTSGKLVPVITYIPINSSNSQFPANKLFSWNAESQQFGSTLDGEEKPTIETINQRLSENGPIFAVVDTYNSSKNPNSDPATSFYSRLVHPDNKGTSFGSGENPINELNFGNVDGNIGIALVID